MYWTSYLKNAPCASEYEAVAVDHLIYLFGSDTVDPERQIDIYILNTNKLVWFKLPDRSDINGVPLKPPDVPSQREMHTVVAYDKKIYLWGGGNSNIACNILYCFNTETLNWSRPRVTGTMPEHIFSHLACTLNHLMYILTDVNDQLSRNIHCLDMKTMDCSRTRIGGILSNRKDYAAIIVNNRLYIFGGTVEMPNNYIIEDSEDEEVTYSTDIIYLDLKSNQWHCPITTGDIPEGRTYHSMFLHNNLIYVFGGFNSSDRDLNDLYCFDTKRNHWNLIKPRGKSPIPRGVHICIVIGDKMFLFGGKSTRGDPYSPYFTHFDTHVVDFNPSLKTLAIMAVVENGLDYSCLPKTIIDEMSPKALEIFSTDN